MTKIAMAAAFVAVMLGSTGCNQSNEKTEAAAQTATHTHESWWCDEHGVPEEICAQCHPKIAAKYKADGDWCQKHDRPDSQCFICHPDYQAKFAAQYEAKYGKQPPKPEIQ